MSTIRRPGNQEKSGAACMAANRLKNGRFLDVFGQPDSFQGKSASRRSKNLSFYQNLLLWTI
jgi:hypothetical protein